jgi:hypothetical protein
MLPCHQLIGSHDSHLHPTKKIKGNFLLPSEETTGKLLMIEFGELATQLNKKKRIHTIIKWRRVQLLDKKSPPPSHLHLD